MSESIKVCPICSASNHRNAAICWNCGTSLASVETEDQKDDSTAGSRPGHEGYRFQHGETDLYEDSLYKIGQRYLFGCFGLLVALLVIGLGLIIGPPAIDGGQDILAGDGEADTTPTPRLQLAQPTVTLGPPTNTPTITVLPTSTPTIVPTRTPCMQTVQQGDNMFNLVSRCGHQSFDVFDEVVEINDLPDAGTIIEGQVLEIPWPTPTPNPNPPTPLPEQPGADAQGESSVDSVAMAQGDTEPTPDVFELEDDELEEFFEIPTATLPPGVQFHVIGPGETLISIIAQYEASVEVLSQLNPEISFNQCDMGMTFGGERCNVMVFQGQQIRVPAALPTATLSPTPSGSETATPTPTATFNAPVSQNPPDRAFFRRDELITLRWVPSGTLGPDDVYRVTVEDRTAGIVYTAETINTSFVIPEAWQGLSEADDPDDEDTTSDRHEYAWVISVVNQNDEDNPTYRTETLTFTWETRIND